MTTLHAVFYFHYICTGFLMNKIWVPGAPTNAVFTTLCVLMPSCTSVLSILETYVYLLSPWLSYKHPCVVCISVPVLKNTHPNPLWCWSLTITHVTWVLLGLGDSAAAAFHWWGRDRRRPIPPAVGWWESVPKAGVMPRQLLRCGCMLLFYNLSGFEEQNVKWTAVAFIWTHSCRLM